MNSIICQDLQYIIDARIPWEKLNGKTVLITGATGMIPSYMALALLYRNKSRDDFLCTVIAQVRNMKKAERIFGEFVGKTYLQIVSFDLVQRIEMDKVDYIIHAASPASPQLFTTHPVDTILPNAIGTYQLLELAKKRNSEGFLLFSSGDVYGQIAEGETVTEETVGSVDQLNMRNTYAEGKRIAETLCKAYWEQYGIKTKIARISHTYGPTMNLAEDRRVFSEFAQNIINHENIVMKSAGTVVRPFCYLSDAVIGLFLILLKGNSGEAYNLCNDECNVSIRELAQRLTQIFPERGLKVVCQERKKDDSYKESLMQVPCYTNNQKIRQLGWKPYIGLEEGFRRTVLSLEESKNEGY